MNLRIINEMRNLSIESRKQLKGKEAEAYSQEEVVIRQKLNRYIDLLVMKQKEDMVLFNKELYKELEIVISITESSSKV